LKRNGVYPNLHHFDSLFYIYDSLQDQQGLTSTVKELQSNDIFPQDVSPSESYTVSFIKQLMEGKKDLSSSSPPTPPPTKEHQSKEHQSDSESKKEKV